MNWTDKQLEEMRKEFQEGFEEPFKECLEMPGHNFTAKDIDRVYEWMAPFYIDKAKTTGEKQDIKAFVKEEFAILRMGSPFNIECRDNLGIDIKHKDMHRAFFYNVIPAFERYAKIDKQLSPEDFFKTFLKPVVDHAMKLGGVLEEVVGESLISNMSLLKNYTDIQKFHQQPFNQSEFRLIRDQFNDLAPAIEELSTAEFLLDRLKSPAVFSINTLNETELFTPVKLTKKPGWRIYRCDDRKTSSKTETHVYRYVNS
jgi:hypothetical protein